MCSNLSLVTISTSFYTFLKSSSLIFVLIVGVITFVEPLSANIVSTVTLVAVGMFLMSYGELHFAVAGAALVIASEVFAAFRWIVTQMLVQDGNLDAMTAVLYMAPASALTLVPIVAARELQDVRDIPAWMHEQGGFARLSLLFFIFPGILAFLLLVIEVQLVMETSSLTMTIFGNLKSVITVLFAMAVFGDHVTVLQWVGMLVVCVGMLGYSQARGEWLAEDALGKMKDIMSIFDTDDENNKNDEQGDIHVDMSQNDSNSDLGISAGDNGTNGYVSSDLRST